MPRLHGCAHCAATPSAKVSWQVAPLRSDLLQVARARSLGRVNDVERDLLAFLEGVEVDGCQLGAMKEHFVAIICAYETKSTVWNDLLDSASGHSMSSRTLADTDAHRVHDHMGASPVSNGNPQRPRWNNRMMVIARRSGAHRSLAGCPLKPRSPAARRPVRPGGSRA